MRCLFVSPEAITRMTGGGIAIEQSIFSIASFADIDIISPNSDYKSNTFGSVNTLFSYSTENLSFFKRMWNLIIYGRPRVPNYKDLACKIEWEKYDFAFFEFPWSYPLIKKASENNIPVFCRFHNVERHVLLEQTIRERRIAFFIMFLKSIGMERKAIKYSYALIFLTDIDKRYYFKKYKKEFINKRCAVIPIAIMDKKMTTISEEKRFNVIFTGQLSYGPNREGLFWFLENGWAEIADMGFTLYVAGGKASNEVKNKNKDTSNIKYIYNPSEEEIEEIFGKVMFSIAPIFWGSGMKVKVVDSLARGIIPIGTEEAFSGYEIRNGKNAFCFKNKEQLVAIFKKIANMPFSSIIKISKDSRLLYETKYCIKNSEKQYRKLILNGEE